MREFIKTLTSMKMMGLLTLIFAFAIALATFIENDFSTNSAKNLIYSAKWFEILLLLLTINLLFNIFRFKLYTRNKFTIFLFHISFILIFIGAGVTRYFGFEGTMSIREGERESKIVSLESYFQLKIESESGKSYYFEDEALLSILGSDSLDRKFKIEDRDVDISLLEYIPNAFETLAQDDSGEPTLSLVIASSGANEPESLAISKGEIKSVDGVNICFRDECNSPINFKLKDEKVYIDSKIDGFKFSMDRQVREPLTKEEVFRERTLYSFGNLNIVLKKFYPRASLKLVSAGFKNEGSVDALKFRVKVDDTIEEVVVFGKSGAISTPKELKVKDLNFKIAYGSKYIPLPFEIELKDFQLQRYIGSMSPSSYASEVRVIDSEYEDFDYRIYMNHILEHRGYRFYQASYDRDEKGTILSVNHDYWGTLITYIGYTLLIIGMALSLFNPNGRFMKLRDKLLSIDREKSALASLVLTLTILFNSNNLFANQNLETIQSFDREHSNRFGELIVQDLQGRFKPLNTLANDILNKVARDSSLYGLSSNQIILSMVARSDIWQNIDIVKVSHPRVNEVLGLSEDRKLLPFSSFFDGSGYRLLSYVEDINRKRPANRSKFDKEVLKVDERVNILYMLYTGELLKIFPSKDANSEGFFSPILAMENFENSKEIKDLVSNYFSAIDRALESSNWSDATKSLEAIEEYQLKYAKDIIEESVKLEAEILYNSLNIFERLFPFYLLIGAIALLFAFLSILKPKLNLELPFRLFRYITILSFAIYTFGLALRWYISGHAPWSDGYESMIYIGWTTILAGLIFSKKSPMTLSATLILTGLTLFVAHLSWLEPQISNLVPVLKSYWLTIHVSLITASYGFLGLGAILGFINLILFIAREPKNRALNLSIKELSIINEMSLIVGLILLTVGNFLGGVWANESWGRYWGWDPKETWALVTILVYLFITHMRFIPNLNNYFALNVASLVGFSSVIMTYFGVNFYLSGLHSYAKGDPVPIPNFVYYTVAIVTIVIVLAYRKRDLK